MSISASSPGQPLVVPRRYENGPAAPLERRAQGAPRGLAGVSPGNGNNAAFRRRAAIHTRVGINPGIIYWRDLQSIEDRRSVPQEGSPRTDGDPHEGTLS